MIGNLEEEGLDYGGLALKKRVSVFLIAAVTMLALVVTGCGASSEPLNMSFPETWQEFSRAAAAEGADALKLMQKEHPKKIPIKKGARMEYSDGTNRFTVWVGGGTNEGHASQMLVDMSNRIGSQNKTFSEPKPVDVGGMTVYRTDGQDKVNYFYVKGALVYWIAISAADPEALLKRVIPEF